MNKNNFIILVLSIIILSLSGAASNAAINVMDISDSPVKTSYKCEYKDCSCTVLVNTYPLLGNKNFYNVVCTGDSLQIKKYRNMSRADVERERFQYCALDSIKN